MDVGDDRDGVHHETASTSQVSSLEAFAGAAVRERQHVASARGPRRSQRGSRRRRRGSSSGACERSNSLGERRQELLRGGAGGRCGRSGSRPGACRSARGRDPRSRRGSRAPRRAAARRGRGCPSASTVVGTYGQASPQPIVTAQSACSCISRQQLCRPAAGEVDADLAPSPRRPSARPALAGSVPADSARMSARRVVVEERLGHLGAPGVVGADEQDVLHEIAPRGSFR